MNIKELLSSLSIQSLPKFMQYTHPFEKNKVLSESFYYLKSTDIVDQTTPNLISWALDANTLQLSTNTNKQAVNLLLASSRKGTRISFTFLELIYLKYVRNNNLINNKLARGGEYYAGKKIFWKATPIAPNSKFYQITLLTNSSPLLIVPQQWLPEFKENSDTLHIDYRQGGRVPKTDLYRLGLVTTIDNKAETTSLFDQLLISWYHWIVQIAISTSINGFMGDLFLEKCSIHPLILEKLKNNNLLQWLQSHLLSIIDIRSNISGKSVPYTKLSVVKIPDQPQSTDLYSIEKRPLINTSPSDIDIIIPFPGSISLVLGKPGSGKSSSMKYLYDQSIEKFFKSFTPEKFPILISPRDLKSKDNVENFLKQHFSSIYDIINSMANAGRLTIILDSWDEINQESRVKLKTWIEQKLFQKNSVIVSSRYQDQYLLNEFSPNSLSLVSSQQIQEIRTVKPTKYSIVPLSSDKLSEYFISRNVDSSRIEELIDFIGQAQIETYPLWMDLISGYFAVNDNQVLNEVNLLNYWIEELISKNPSIKSYLDKLEEFAFQRLVEYQVIFKEGQIKRHISRDSGFIQELHEAGWIVPIDNELQSRSYEFVHKRLMEYLAARFLALDWENLEYMFHEQHPFLLARSDFRPIIELSLHESRRLEFTDKEIINGIYSLIGEDTWETLPHNLDLLRAPLFGSYLITVLDVIPPWFDSLRDILLLIYQKEISDPQSSLFRWINRDETIVAYLSLIPDQLLKNIHNQPKLQYPELFFSHISHIKPPSQVVNSVLRVLQGNIFQDLKYLKTFLDILYSYSSNLKRWKATIQAIIQSFDPISYHIGTIKIERNTIYQLILFAHQLDSTLLVDLLSKLLSTKHKETHQLFGNRSLRDIFLQVNLLEDICRYQLQSGDDYYIEVAIDDLYEFKNNLTIPSDQIVEEELPVDKYELWFQKALGTHDVQDQWDTGVRDTLFKWILQHKSLYDVLQQSRHFFYNQHHPFPVDYFKKHWTKKLSREEFDEIYQKLSNLIHYKELFDWLKSLVDEDLEELNISEYMKTSDEIKLDVSLESDKTDFNILLKLLDKDITEYTKYKILSSLAKYHSPKLIPKLKQLQIKDYFFDLWQRLLDTTSLNQDIVNFGISHNNELIRWFLLVKLIDELQNKIYTHIDKLSLFLDDSDRDCRLKAALAFESMPYTYFEQYFPVLFKKKDDELFNIGLRLLYERLGGKFNRIVKKLTTYETYEYWYPIFEYSQIRIGKLSEYNPDWFVYLSNDDRSKKKNPSTINLGKRFIDWDRNRAYGPIISLARVGFEQEGIKSIKSMYFLTNVPRSPHQQSLINQYLKIITDILQSENNKLIINTLIWLEDLLEIHPDLFKSVKELITPLVHQSVYLYLPEIIILRHGNKQQIANLITNTPTILQFNQIIVWNLGRRSDSFIVDILQSTVKKLIFPTALNYILPFVVINSRLFIETWSNLLLVNLSTISRKPWHQQFDYSIAFLDCTLRTHSDIEVPNVNPMTRSKYFVLYGVDQLINLVNSNFKLTAKEFNQLKNMIAQHSSQYMQDLFQVLEFLSDRSTAINIYNKYITSKNVDDLILIWEFILELDDKRKTEYFIHFLHVLLDHLSHFTSESTDEEKYDNKFYDEWLWHICNQLLHYPDMRILAIIERLFELQNQDEEEIILVAWRTYAELAHKLWGFHFDWFYKEDYDQLLDWLEHIYQKDLKYQNLPGFYQIEPNILQHILENITSDPPNRLRDSINRTLYSHLYCILQDFWSYFLK